eukprot:9502716-Pyramimonas_sp.AAC.1
MAQWGPRKSGRGLRLELKVGADVNDNKLHAGVDRRDVRLQDHHVFLQVGLLLVRHHPREVGVLAVRHAPAHAARMDVWIYARATHSQADKTDAQCRLC